MREGGHGCWERGVKCPQGNRKANLWDDAISFEHDGQVPPLHFLRAHPPLPFGMERESDPPGRGPVSGDGVMG